MTKTRRGSKKCNKRKTTRRRQHKKGGGPKIDPSKQKTEKAKVIAQPLSFTPAAHDLLLMQSSADHMLRHLGIKTTNIHHSDPESAVRVPLERARARVMVNATIDAIHASVDSLRARGDFANACVQLDRALELGSMRARVELADMLYDGRIGAISRVDADRSRAIALVVPEEEEDDYAKVKNNPDCMGLVSFFEFADGEYSDRVRDDAVKSAKAKSKYGTFALGEYFLAMPSAHGHPRATQCFKISAKNANYDRAQDALGLMLSDLDLFPPEDPVESAQLEKDRGKALRLFTSAANQGLPIAMFHLGDLYRVEAERLRPTADDADLRRMISDARRWYQLSHLPHNDELAELEALEMSLDVGNE